MSLVKRAGLYCLRQRGRTVILFLVLTLILGLLLTGIAVRDASAGAGTQVRTAVGGKLLLETDTEGHMGSGQQNQWGTVYSYEGDMITEEIVSAVGKVDGVTGCNSEDREAYYGAGVNFQYLPAAFGLSYTPYGESSAYTAVLSSEKCKDFLSGKYRLTEGRHITPEDRQACMISKELADYNQLSVGSRIKMYSLDSDQITEFEIVGIFDGTEGTSGNAMTVDEIPANCGYIDHRTLFDLFGEELGGYQQLTVYVEDPLRIQEVYDRISALPELAGKTLKLTIDTEEYEMVSAPLASLQGVADAMLLLISLAGILVLTVLLTIWIRGRKREIGILLAVGKSKAGIWLQFFTELFFAAAVAFLASVPLSGLTAKKAGELLISREAEKAVGVQVQIEAGYLFPLCLIGIFLIAVSAAVSSWTVLRLKPGKLLTKMS